VPRWVHVWAIVTVPVAFVLVAVGGLVTTYRAGMADPVWPTAPWYLFTVSWSEPKPGYFIEHTHRLAAWLIGVLTFILAVGIWLTERRSWARWAGLVGLLALLGSYLGFHQALWAQINCPTITVPMDLVAGIGVSLAAVLALSASGGRGSILRAAGVLTLVAVMIQGLLGGFRVRLNAWLGVDLAAFHGVFAHVVFCMLVGLAVATAPTRPWAAIPEEQRRRCWQLAAVLTLIAFMQLIFGALVRHNPTPITQRLHLIFAFAVVAHFVALLKYARSSPTAWRRLRGPLNLLSVLVVLQIVLGVEAWMGKFNTGILPELQRVTTGQVIIRTTHVLSGACILATAVVVALQSGRPAAISQDVPAADSQNIISAPEVVVGAHQLGGVS
jgi:heme A synthase